MALPSLPEKEGHADRVKRVRSVVDDYGRRRAAGEEISDEVLLARYPDLLPELAEELRKLRLIENARRRAFLNLAPDAGSTTCAAWVAPLSDDGPPGDSGERPDVPDYDLVKSIGAGSFGEVWLARNRLDGHFFAIKVIPQGKPVELDGVRLYRRHANDHPCLVPIEHVGGGAGFYYCVMPLADDANGSAAVRSPQQYEPMTLERHLARQGRLPLDEVLAVAEHLLAALEHLHASGVIHCDVKPGNVLRLNGTWRLGDLGLMVAGERVQPNRGTPAFWPPEGPRDPTADLYALGKTLYLLLTGAGLDRFQEFVDGTLKRPGDDPRAEALRQIIRRACQGDPSCRFASATAMRRAIAPLRAWWKSWRQLAVFASVILALGAALILARGVVSSNPADPDGPEVKPPLKGWIDVRVWEPKSERRKGLRLRQDGALPLRADDRIRVEAGLNRPAYAYVFWINPEGKVFPVFPWTPGRWDQRPAEERAVTVLSLPEEDPGGGWPIKRGPAGMETLVLLARETPLPPAVDLQPLLTGLPWQKMQNLQAVVWFENGEVVQGEAEREPSFFNMEQIDDPLLQTQQLLRERLRPYCAYSRAVSFANQGK